MKRPFSTDRFSSLRLQLIVGVLGLCLPSLSPAQVGPGNVLIFNGPTNQMAIAHQDLPPPWTAELWVKRHKSPGSSAPLLLSANAALKLEQFGSSRQVGITRYGVSDQSFDVSTPTNEWVHLAFVGSSNQISLVVNGNLIDTLPFSIPLPLEAFGWNSRSTNEQLRAEVDELRVWSIARSPASIRAHLGRRLSGTEPGLISYWRFDEPGGLTASNSVPDGPRGSLVAPVRTLSSIPFAPDLSVPGFTLEATNSLRLHATINPGNLLTTVRFVYTTNSVPWLPAVNAPTAFLSATNGIMPSGQSFLLPPPAHTALGRIVASNALGVTWSDVARVPIPLLTLNGANPVISECDSFYQDPGINAQLAPYGLGAGYFHALAIRGDGTVISWGVSYSGATNPPSSLTNAIAVAGGAEFSLALRANGEVVAWGKNTQSSLKPPAAASPAVAVAAGDDHALALSPQGTVTGWGDNSYGQINIPTNLPPVIDIAAGQNFSLALAADGRVFAWGNPGNIPSNLTNIAQIAALDENSVALRADGTVVSLGARFSPPTPVGVSNVLSILAGGTAVVARRANGTFISWGDSRIVPPAPATNASALVLGGNFAVAILPQGQMLTWGSNWDDQTNLPSHYLQSLPYSTGTTTNANIPNEVTLTYSVMQPSGQFSISRTILTRDTTPPSFVMNGQNPLSWPPSTPFIDPGVSIYDACDPAPRGQTNNTVNVAIPGTYTVTYTALDAAGNPAAAVRTVIVQSATDGRGDLTGDGVVDQKDLTFLLNRLHNTGAMADADLRAVLNYYYSQSPWVGLTNVVGLGASKVVFSMLNGPGTTNFMVESSSDLVHWMHLGPAVPRFEFTDTNAPTTQTIRTYRLRWPGN